MFRRNINYYIMGLFVPSMLIVLLSWLGFWIDKESTPGRVSLSLLTILTMQNQVSKPRLLLYYMYYLKTEILFHSQPTVLTILKPENETTLLIVAE